MSAANSETAFVDKTTFNEAIAEYLKVVHASTREGTLDRDAISEAIRMIEEYKAVPKSEKRTVRRPDAAKNYDVLVINGVKELILKRNSPRQEPVVVPAYTRYFEILSKTHKNTYHGDKDQMLLALRKSYCIPQSAVALFVQKCSFCRRRRNVIKHGVAVEPTSSTHFGDRGQLDLIDLQYSPDGDYCWILHYQDHYTRYSFLRALKSDNAKEITRNLYNIFVDFGYPRVLLSEKSYEFTATIIVKLLDIWPDCHIKLGKAEHFMNGNLRKTNTDIKFMLSCSMTTRNSESWSAELRNVQWVRNKSLQRTIKTTPYTALFGKESDRPDCYSYFTRPADVSSDENCDEQENVNSRDSASPAHLMDSDDSSNEDSQSADSSDEGTSDSDDSHAVSHAPTSAAKGVKRSAEDWPERPAQKFKNSC